MKTISKVSLFAYMYMYKRLYFCYTLEIFNCLLNNLMQKLWTSISIFVKFPFECIILCILKILCMFVLAYV